MTKAPASLSANEFLRAITGSEAGDESNRKILIFDQFESFFLWEENQPFHHNFYGHVKNLLQARLNCDLVFIVRDTFFAHLQDFESVVPGILEEQIRIKPLDASQAGVIIEQICQRGDFVLEDTKLFEETITKIKDEEGKINLTYLQVFLKHLFAEAEHMNV